MNKQKKVIIAVLTLVVTMVVGYALFSDTITINGTATSKGNFDMKILDASITKEVGSNGATATITNGGKGLKLVIPNLKYPGAYVRVKYKIKNTGTIPALFKMRTMDGITLDEYDNLKRIYLSVPLSKLFYQPGEEKEEEFVIGWNSSDTSSSLDESVNITYNISFVQVGDEKEACNKLELLKKGIETYTLSGGEYNSGFTEDEMDINGDTYVDNGDANLLSTIMLGMSCPSN